MKTQKEIPLKTPRVLYWEAHKIKRSIRTKLVHALPGWFNYGNFARTSVVSWTHEIRRPEDERTYPTLTRQATLFSGRTRDTYFSASVLLLNSRHASKNGWEKQYVNSGLWVQELDRNWYFYSIDQQSLVMSVCFAWWLVRCLKKMSVTCCAILGLHQPSIRDLDSLFYIF